MKNFQLTINVESSTYLTRISTLAEILLWGSEADIAADNLLSALRHLSERVDAYAQWRGCTKNEASELTEVSAALRSLADKIDRG